ncbi:MAG: PDZ domain-containing protein [Polyangiaceae bacterium]|nr:PDZ domain-containing protein [Polyangiaceae bacterium]
MKGPLALLLLIVSSFALACGAVYPELKTSVRPPGSQALSPPPPDDVLFLRFASATIPERTRDGRRWSNRGVDAPDPFAKVFVDDAELFRTPVQPDTLTPTWRDAERHNYRVPKGATVRVELWDKNPINNQPICVRRVQNIHSYAAQGELDMECESGARIKLRVEPAHGLIGLGFAYELRSRDVVITRVVADSPAGRVGVVVGDFVLAIEGRKVRDMKEDEPRSLINANGPTGLTMTLRHKDGSTVDVSFKEGALYPVKSDDIPIP